MMVQRFLCRAPCRRIEVWLWRKPRATAIPSSSLKRRTTCQLNLAEHSTYPHFQVFFTRTDTALRGMKRCLCRSLLLPTTRIGTSLLLPSLQVHVGDLKFNQQHKKKINKKYWFQKAHLSFWYLSHWLPGRVQDACEQFFLRSEVCGGGLEDYSSQAQGASHHILQQLLYSIIISVWQAKSRHKLEFQQLDS